MTWATSVLILIFLGLSVLDLGPMYATDRRQTDVRQKHRLMPRLLGVGNNKYPSTVRLVKSSTRYIILQFDQTILLNVYLPCSSVAGRDDDFVDRLSCIINDITDIQYSSIFF